jgi:hypothetical protein
MLLVDQTRCALHLCKLAHFAVMMQLCGPAVLLCCCVSHLRQVDAGHVGIGAKLGDYQGNVPGA